MYRIRIARSFITILTRPVRSGIDELQANTFPIWIQRYSSSWPTGGRSRFISKPPSIGTLESANDMKLARSWIDDLTKCDIPREIVELNFSRSSGPGGQNVNKVNTKCTIRVPLSSWWIPEWAKTELKKNPAYVLSSDTLLVSSTLTRSQAQNVEDCLAKLKSLVISASSISIRGETSDEQKQRVASLKRIEKARRRKDKDCRSQVKKNRAKREWD